MAWGYCQKYAERGSTLRLRERNNTHRTSVEMIEKFCASHIKNQLSTAAINVKRLPKTDEAHAAPEVPSPAKPSHLKAERHALAEQATGRKPLA